MTVTGFQKGDTQMPRRPAPKIALLWTIVLPPPKYLIRIGKSSTSPKLQNSTHYDGPKNKDNVVEDKDNVVEDKDNVVENEDNVVDMIEMY